MSISFLANKNGILSGTWSPRACHAVNAVCAVSIHVAAACDQEYTPDKRWDRRYNVLLYRILDGTADREIYFQLAVSTYQGT
jgi:hypothetical protein